MQIKTHGHLAPPPPHGHTAVLGTFDPWLTHHEELIETLADHGRQSGQCTAVIWLNPPPREILQGKEPPPPCVTRAQAQRFLDCGIQAVFEVRLSPEELASHAFDFLNELRRHVRLEEFWIGQRQSLGSGPLGSIDAVRQYCDKAGIRLYRLDTPIK